MKKKDINEYTETEIQNKYIQNSEKNNPYIGNAMWNRKKAYF